MGIFYSDPVVIGGTRAMPERFDAVVVGGGPAGGLAAYALARARRSVLLLPHPSAAPPGALPGGIAWRSPLGARCPTSAADGLPLDRRIIERRLALLSPESSLSIDFRDLSWAAPEAGGWVIERARWDAWATGAGSKRGVVVWKDAKVESFARDRAGRVTGLTAGGRSAEATVTLLEDPSVLPIAARNGLRLGGAVGRAPLGSGGESVVASVFDLPVSRVDDRFGAGPGRGFTWEVVLGFLPKGAMGYGFLYPGHASVHAGVVVEDRSLAQAGITAAEVARRFESHPAIAPFLREGKRSSTVSSPTSTRLSGGLKLHGDGFLLLGEAAAAGAAPGIVLRGMDAQAESGWAAAETAREALETQDVSGRVLSRYVARLRAAGVLDRLGRADRRAAHLKWNPRLHQAYPALFRGVLRRMMTEKGQPKEHMRDILREALEGSHVPYTALARDAMAALGSL